ncbi:Golgi apparatus membrane protein TVP38 [Dentipellis sp. KUC8613]|nr:Golgi apparatus membrane protein TVP38 [Dentipellis sp. KUC8613]
MTGTKQLSSFLATFYHHYVKAAFSRFRKLSLAWKLVLTAILSFYTAVVVVIIILHPARVAQFFYDLSQRISGHPLGWLLLSGMIMLVSFPPMIGHTTMLEVCGFAYGTHGFWVAAPASLFGSAIVFIVLRYMFSHRVHRWSSNNERWQALEAVINAKGLPLMVLIRLSPFPPWVYSNALFSSIKAVSIWQFMIATICIFPRFLLYVFIGSRLAALSDGNQRGEMDTQTKIINGLFVAGGIAVGVAAGWIVYSLMEKELKGVSPEIDELAAEAIEDADEGAPLLDNFSSTSTLAGSFPVRL